MAIDEQHKMGQQYQFEPSERQPLLASQKTQKHQHSHLDPQHHIPHHHGVIARRDPRRTQSETVVYQKKKEEEEKEQPVGLKRHITLLDCVAIIVGNVIGSGIFISPKGVYENSGSVGACLMVWGIMGVYALIQALCYAELAAVIPRAGGDYAYVYYLLGRVPAFLCVWVQIVITATSANGVISQTAGIYLMQPFGLECETSVASCIAILIIFMFTALNIYSSWFSAKIQLLFSGAKVLALCTIIIAGIVMIFNGHTENFQNPFDGTTRDIGKLSLAALDGYFAYKGWELVNTLPEEMINPKRDLPIGVVIAMLLITTIYVLTNVAYFSMLSPYELINSKAVALSFTEKTLGGPTSLLIAVGVAMSCMGSVNGSLLSDPKYLFAAGRTRQVPHIFSMIHVRYMTPVVAIIVACILSVMYGLIPSVDQLQQYTSMAVQLKILTALIGLLYFRWRKPHIVRPIKIPMIIIIAVVVFMIVLLSLSVYSNPSTTGVGLAIFLMGVPVTLLGEFCTKRGYGSQIIDSITVVLQQLCLVVPEVKQEDDEFTAHHK